MNLLVFHDVVVRFFDKISIRLTVSLLIYALIVRVSEQLIKIRFAKYEATTI